MCLLAFLLIYERYIILKETSKTETENQIQKHLNDLKDSYLTRYQTKLINKVEISLEINKIESGSSEEDIDTTEEMNSFDAINTIIQDLETERRLLILGKKGAGKTVLLLHFALLMIEQHEKNKTPFPVIFDLKSWSEESGEFSEWLIKMLEKFNVPKEIATILIKENRIFPLLDGLDELALGQESTDKIRESCLRSIYKYGGNVGSYVVCCRDQQFKPLIKLTEELKDLFRMKVEIKDLSTLQVLYALKSTMMDYQNPGHKSAGKIYALLVNKEAEKLVATWLNMIDTKSNLIASKFEGAFSIYTDSKRIKKNGLQPKNVINEEQRIFFETLKIPFYFTLALELFQKESFDQNSIPKDSTKLEDFLVREFIEIELNEPNNPNYTTQNIRKWLNWLAQLMEKKNSTYFELLMLQSSDLTNQLKYSYGFTIVFGLLMWTIMVLYDLNFGLFIKTDILWILRISVLPVSILIGGSIFYLGIEIPREDQFNFDFTKIFSLVFIFGNIATFIATFIGFFSVQTLMYFIIGSIFPPLIAFSFIILRCILGGIIGCIVFSFKQLKKVTNFVRNDKPYAKIISGIRFLLLFFLSIWLLLYGSFATLVIKSTAIPTDAKLGILISFFVVSILLVGEIALLTIRHKLLQHFILRFYLYLEDGLTLKLVTFLDYVTEKRLLEKDGGNWRFRHESFQRYFATVSDR